MYKTGPSVIKPTQVFSFDFNTMNETSWLTLVCYWTLKNRPNLPGFEPGIFWSVVRRVIHCATGPSDLWRTSILYLDMIFQKYHVCNQFEDLFNPNQTSLILCTKRAYGGLAQMVERSLSMWEVPGSIPGFSKHFFNCFDLISSMNEKHKWKAYVLTFVNPSKTRNVGQVICYFIDILYQTNYYCISVCIWMRICFEKNFRTCQDSNLESSDP